MTDKEKLIKAFAIFKDKGYAAVLGVDYLDSINLLKDQMETTKAVYIFEDDLTEALNKKGNLKKDLILYYDIESIIGMRRTQTHINYLAKAGLKAEPLKESWEDSIIIRAEKRGRKNGNTKTAGQVQK